MQPLYSVAGFPCVSHARLDAAGASYRADMSTGDVVAFITTGGLLAKPIRQLTEVIAIVQRGIAAAADLFDVLDQPTELDEGQHASTK